MKCYISCNVGKHHIIAVWACKNYIEDAYTYFSVHQNKIKENTIIIGDLNSNKKWDQYRHHRTHGKLVDLLKTKKLTSIYHKKINHGEEKENTFFMYKNEEKAYHIDYCFCNELLNSKIQIEKFEKYKKLSDHVPLIVTIKKP